jgi:tetratricopeptide (TPR) repeat protein
MGPGYVYISKKRNLKPLAALILFLLVATMFCSYLTDSRIKTSKQNFYFVPPLKYLTLASATHKSLWAYLLFIRGILDLNEAYPVSINRMDYLLADFKAAGTLEPRLTKAYFFGGIVAPSTSVDISKAVAFLEEAARLEPGEWKYAFWAGLDYLELGNYPKAAEYYRKAAELPGSPGYLKTNLAFLYYKSGEFNQGIAYLQALMYTLKDKRLIELLSRKIDWLQNLAFLEGELEQYHQAYGKWPETLSELKDKGLIREIPQDVFGRGFYLEKSPDSAKPKVKSGK